MLGEAIALAVALARRAQIRGRLHAADQGRRADPADGRRRDHLRRIARLCAIRRGASSPGLRRPGAGVLGAAAVGRGLSRPHRRPGRAYRALSGHRRARRARHLAECVHHYFRQSEQVEAGIKVAVARRAAPDGGKAWRAGALMIERLPRRRAAEASREAEDDGWRRAMILMSTSTAGELLDPELPPERSAFPPVPRGRRARLPAARRSRPAAAARAAGSKPC